MPFSSHLNVKSKQCLLQLLQKSIKPTAVLSEKNELTIFSESWFSYYEIACRLQQYKMKLSCMYSKCNDLLAYQVIIDAFSSPICLVFSVCQIASRYATTRELEALLVFDVWLLYLEKSRICSLILIKGLRGQIRWGKFEIAFSLYQTVLMFSRHCLSLSENMVPKNVFVSMIVG